LPEQLHLRSSSLLMLVRELVTSWQSLVMV
jgi:hypothetical protein